MRWPVRSLIAASSAHPHSVGSLFTAILLFLSPMPVLLSIQRPFSFALGACISEQSQPAEDQTLCPCTDPGLKLARNGHSSFCLHGGASYIGLAPVVDFRQLAESHAFDARMHSLYGCEDGLLRKTLCSNAIMLQRLLSLLPH